MEKKIRKILITFKDDNLLLENAIRELLKITGHRKTTTCKLDRLQDHCSIFENTTGGCENCGHHF